MSWVPELPLNVPAMTIYESAFSNVAGRPTQHKSSVDSLNRNEERLSKLSNGEGVPERWERDPESQQTASSVRGRVQEYESKSYTHGLEKSPQKESGVDSHQRAQARFSKQSKGNVDAERPERAFSNVAGRPTQHKSSVDSLNRNEERLSKLSNGEGVPERWESDPEPQQTPCSVRGRVQEYESKYLTHGPERSPQKESRVDSPKGPQENFSKQSMGNADPVTLERGRTVEMITSRALESMREEVEKILSEKLAALQRQLEVSQHAKPPMEELDNTLASLQKISENMQALQKGLENMQMSTKEDLQMLRADLEERVAKAWNTPERSESNENLLEVEKQAGRTVEMITSRALESMREEVEKILSEKLAALQRQPEVSQHVKPPMEELDNTWTSLQKISENMQALQKGLENMQMSTKEDLQMLRADLEERVAKAWNTPERSESNENLLEVEKQAGRTVEMITSRALESMREEVEKILSEKLAALQRQLEVSQHAKPPMEELDNTWTSLQKISENMQALQKGLENMQMSTEEDLQKLRAYLKRSFIEQRYMVDVTLNADTAHPRLEVSEDGKSVNDTGVIRQVPSKEERFDSHLFVLAKEGYASGRHYWVVDVGRRRNWILGVASESVARKGTVILSPKNGFWVIALADGQEYWAHTDPWTRLTVSGRPQKIGIFLDISANKLSFYNAHKKSALYTFTTIGDSGQKRKLVPFFSTGSGASVLDTEPLKIVQGFDDDD